MHIFYSKTYDGKIFTLDDSESKHLSKVLRLKEGDDATVIDGSGSVFHCKVKSSDHRMATLEVFLIKEIHESRNYYLHIAIAPTKNIDRFEWFVEKSVELGIDKITPIICERSERRIVKTARIKKIIISAMKQSLNPLDTEICEVLPFSKIVSDHTFNNRFIAHCIKGDSIPGKATDRIKPKENGLILIGPEGDFSPDEVKLAKENGFEEISFGTSRLRTETAGVVACSTFYFINM